MTPNNESTTMMEQAAQWMSRLGADDSPRWDDPELTAWLDQSHQHREAFAEVSAIWFAADQVRLGEHEHSAGDDVALPGSLPLRSRRRWPLLTGALLIVLTALWLPNLPRQLNAPSADYAAGPGPGQMLTLADGTRVKLAGDSAASAATDGRGLTLHYGEMFLDVAHDPSQPFVVSTPVADVTVLGTRFGVSWRHNQHRTGVLSGRVRVDYGQQQGLVLNPGELALNGAMDPSPAAMQRYFGWQSGNLVFDAVPLDQVLNRLAPFMPGTVVKLPGTGNPDITAVVAIDGTTQMLQTLAASAGLQLISAGPLKLLY